MKFTTPVSMKVTQEQFEKDLKSQLESLGYYYDDEFAWELLSQYLITYIEDDDNCFFFNQDENGDDCYYIDHYNPELFLALAAINDGIDLVAGEWMYCVEWEGNHATTGKVYKTVGNDQALGNDKIVDLSCGKWRKATKEEIINHLPFKVPEKWYVKPNNIEEAKILAKYFDDNKCGAVVECNFYSDRLNRVLMDGLSNHHGYYKGARHTEITFEQFKKYILKQETMKTYPITRKQLAEIYNIACSEWKERISKITQDTLGSFSENGYLDGRIVQEMFKAATSEQKPVLEKIFGAQDKNAFVKGFEWDELSSVSKKLFGSSSIMQILFKNNDFEQLNGRAIWLSGDFVIPQIHKDKKGNYIIEITKK